MEAGGHGRKGTCWCFPAAESPGKTRRSADTTCGHLVFLCVFWKENAWAPINLLAAFFISSGLIWWPVSSHRFIFRKLASCFGRWENGPRLRNSVSACFVDVMLQLLTGQAPQYPAPLLQRRREVSSVVPLLNAPCWTGLT